MCDVAARPCSQSSHERQHPPRIRPVCTILLAWRCHPDAPVILAANRDELLARAERSSGRAERRPARDGWPRPRRGRHVARGCRRRHGLRRDQPPSGYRQAGASRSHPPLARRDPPVPPLRRRPSGRPGAPRGPRAGPLQPGQRRLGVSRSRARRRGRRLRTGARDRPPTGRARAHHRRPRRSRAAQGGDAPCGDGLRTRGRRGGPGEILLRMRALLAESRLADGPGRSMPHAFTAMCTARSRRRASSWVIAVSTYEHAPGRPCVTPFARVATPGLVPAVASCIALTSSSAIAMHRDSRAPCRARRAGSAT